jgi:hypothetical protein
VKVNRCSGRTCLLASCVMLVSSLALSSLKMELKSTSKTSVDFRRISRRYIPNHRTLHSYRCENLESYIVKKLFVLPRHHDDHRHHQLGHKICTTMKNKLDVEFKNYNTFPQMLLCTQWNCHDSGGLRVTYKTWFRIGWLELLTPYSYTSGLQLIERYR